MPSIHLAIDQLGLILTQPGDGVRECDFRGIVGPTAGDMIGEVALAIEMGCDAVDIGETIHPHPTLGESISMAAEVAHGSCTDLPAMKKKAPL